MRHTYLLCTVFSKPGWYTQEPFPQLLFEPVRRFVGAGTCNVLPNIGHPSGPFATALKASERKGFIPARKNLLVGVVVGALLLVLVILAVVFTPENPPSPPAGRMKPPQPETSVGG